MPKRAVFERSRLELSLDVSVGVHILLVVEQSSLESQSRGCAKTLILTVCHLRPSANHRGTQSQRRSPGPPRTAAEPRRIIEVNKVRDDHRVRREPLQNHGESSRYTKSETITGSAANRCRTTTMTAAKKMLNDSGDSTHPCRRPGRH